MVHASALSPLQKEQVTKLNENKCMWGWNTKKPIKLDGNDTTTLHTIPTSCAILPQLTQIYFVCLLVVCRGLWKAVQWVVLGVHVDVDGEWVMLWVTAMYNVLAILSLTNVVCLACMQKL